MKDTVSSITFKNGHVSIHEKSCKDLSCLAVAAFMQRYRKSPQRQNITLNIIMLWTTENKQKYPQVYKDSGFCGT